MSASVQTKLALRIFLGLGFGGILLWLAISQFDLTQAKSALSNARVKPLVFALTIYWCAMAVRTIRWRLLLSPTKLLTFAQVGRSLIVGYTVNNLLPARLGEVFRVDFVGRHYRIARSSVLASVIMERLADALAAVVLLVFGLAYSDFKSDNSAIISATVAVTVLIGLIIFGVAIVILWHERLLRNRFQWLSERLAILAQSVTALNRGLILQAITTTVVIWSLEAIVLKLVMSGFGISARDGVTESDFWNVSIQYAAPFRARLRRFDASGFCAFVFGIGTRSDLGPAFRNGSATSPIWHSHHSGPFALIWRTPSLRGIHHHKKGPQG